MTNYPIPASPGPQRVVFRQASANFLAQSPFTYRQQVLNHPGRRWEADVTMPPMKNDQAREWLAWLARLDGQLNTFTMGDPLNKTPRGAATANGTFAADAAIGASAFTVDGSEVATWLKAGDYMQIGTGADARLHMVTADTTRADPSGAPGEHTVNAWPPLYAAASSGDAVTVLNPVGVFRLSSNVRQWSLSELFYGITFSAVSVV